jgi:mannose-1-phosphate guanylyltransferase
MTRVVPSHRALPDVAIVLAGGLGTRMHPLSTDRPKHLLEVAGEPVVVHQLRWLASHGVVEVVLATSYLGDQFEPVLGDGSRWGVRLRYTCEPRPAGTAGGLRLAAAALTSLPERVIVVNGDLLTSHDLTRQLMLAVDNPGAGAVLHIRTVLDARPFGCVVANATGRVSSFVEKTSTPASPEVNAGTYVVARSVLESIPDGIVSLERDVLPAVVERGRVMAYREDALWEDVGTPEALVRASRALVLGSGREAHIDPTALVDPAAVVSDGSAVGPGAVVEAGARVVGSVVMSRAVVEAHALVEGSAVAPGARVRAGAVIRGIGS